MLWHQKGPHYDNFVYVEKNLNIFFPLKQPLGQFSRYLVMSIRQSFCLPQKLFILNKGERLFSSVEQVKVEVIVTKLNSNMIEMLIKMITLEESVHHNSVSKEGKSNIEFSKKKVVKCNKCNIQLRHKPCINSSCGYKT